MPILPVFQQFPEEAALIGRMLEGYANLEIDLMHCASAVRADLDLALKTMFRGRGNAQRISVAQAIAREPYVQLGLEAELDAAIGAMRYCLKIRNLYAHCNWWDDHSGRMAFANLEELAQGNAVVADLTTLTVNHVTTQHLQMQLAYFDYTEYMIFGVINEGLRRSGKGGHPQYLIKPAIPQPPLVLP